MRAPSEVDELADGFEHVLVLVYSKVPYRSTLVMPVLLVYCTFAQPSRSWFLIKMFKTILPPFPNPSLPSLP